MDRRSKAGLVFIFLLALLPRLIYPVSRPMQWYDRSVNFWDGLLAGDLRATYQEFHPGVTTMWIAGAGLSIYAAVHDWSRDDLHSPPPDPSGVRACPIAAGVAALSFVIAACIGLAYVLLARLVDWPVAFAGGCLLALDPFHITQSKILHVDGLLASFMLVSVLYLLCYLQHRKTPCLILSGAFAGLALLTKAVAGFLAPCALFITLCFVLSRQWVARDRSTENLGGGRRWGQRAWEAIRTLMIWGAVAGLVFVLLWPAMWSIPLEVLSNIVQHTLFWAETAHDSPTVFAGRIFQDDPGPLYYVAALAWHTTLITLPACIAAILLLFRQWRRGESNRPLWWILFYGASFFLFMVLGAKKMTRYLVPTFLALDVLAAWGLVQVARIIGRSNRLRRLSGAARIPAAMVAVALVLQAGTVLRHHPYYSTHRNLLLGGPWVAQHILAVGEQGEGLDLAARFLNSYPGAERRAAGLQRRSGEIFPCYFAGDTRPIQDPDVDYWVFAVNPIQRRNRIVLWGDIWDACQRVEPLWSVSFDGIPYVWIYPAYPHDAEASDVPLDRRLDVRLGDHIHLLGYQLGRTRGPALTDSESLLAGDTLTVTLFWQSDGRVTEDAHVFVHMLNAQGRLAAQHDGVPVQGNRPTWDWRDREIVQDEHVLVSDVGLSAGTYRILVGMYEFPSLTRLPATDPTGERLPEDRVPLGRVQVSPP